MSGLKGVAFRLPFHDSSDRKKLTFDVVVGAPQCPRGEIEVTLVALAKGTRGALFRPVPVLEAAGAPMADAEPSCG